MPAQLFEMDDSGWLDWASTHPDAVALNVRASLEADYRVLHRATCATITRPAAHGAYTERGYRKVGGTEAELSAWVTAHGGGMIRRCGICRP